MSKKHTKRAQEELKMDMTPMIDVVFLLIIFFVLVIDLSQQELEDLILPMAKYAVPDDQPPENRPVMNITQDGRMIYKRNTYYDPLENGEDFEGIVPMLFEWRDSIALEKDVPGALKNITYETMGGGMKMTVVNVPVLLRADKWTEWHYVGKFMEKCTHPKAAFWMLELALSEEDKELKFLAKLKK